MGRIIAKGPEVISGPRSGRNVAYALYAAQNGEMAPSAKPMKGFGGGSVMEIVAPFSGDTWRAVYVLHAFQKKSKSGRATLQKELELIRQRLAAAERDYKERSAPK